MKRIAIIDDDPEFLDFLEKLIGSSGYATLPYASTGQFLDSLAKNVPDLVVMDLQLPGVSGWEVIRLLKALDTTRNVPIVIVTGEYCESQDAVRALNLGADEYFKKPVEGELLLAQIAALLRRVRASAVQEADDDRLTLGPIAINFGEHVARVDGEEIHLTPLEFDLLVHLMRNRNRVLTRGLLLAQVWKEGASTSTRSVDKRIEALRKKMGEHGESIHTVSGVGYCLRL